MTSVRACEYESTSPAMTMDIAAALASSLSGGDLVTLAGELGAGKTCFVRGLARGLGLDERVVASPTFVLVHEYTPTKPGNLGLIHIDAYRLNGSDELESIGWRELLERTDAIIAIEWPERIADEIPADCVDVHLAHGPDSEIRFITIERIE